MAYIELRSVSVSYVGTNTALSDCSVSIEKGEFVFLVGRTGAGKSTLLKLLSREVKPSAGQIVLNGRDVGKISALAVPKFRRSIGIVPQDFGLLPKKTVSENLAYASRALGKTRRQTKRRVPFVMIAVNILHKENNFPAQLSGGEQQRVAIGRALVNDPPLILADEPTGNLDPEHSEEIMQLLLELNARGTTVVVASHDMAIVEKFGRRVIQFEDGKIVQDSGKQTPVAIEVEEIEEDV